MGKAGKQFVLSIMSRDRIGIVYEVSTAISELEGDIADLRQSVLRGCFTMILLASFPETITEGDIRQRLLVLNLDGEPSLEIAIKRAEDVTIESERSALENAYVLTASGPDRIGFLATVSAFCAGHGMNILDLSTAVRGVLYHDLARRPGGLSRGRWHGPPGAGALWTRERTAGCVAALRRLSRDVPRFVWAEVSIL